MLGEHSPQLDTLRSSPDLWLQHWTENLCSADDQPKRPRAFCRFVVFQAGVLDFIYRLCSLSGHMTSDLARL